MKVPIDALNLTAFARRILRSGPSHLWPVIFAGMLLLQTHSAEAALSFARGTATSVGCVRYANSPDSVTITAGLTAPGTITSGLSIPANRIQYDIINCDTGPMLSWTVFYAPSVGPAIIGAFTPLGFIDFTGAIVPQGGFAYTTLFNAGYGIYTYNTGAPWIIDYEPDHITFTATTPNVLPANAGVGYLSPTYYLPSFAILYDPELGNGLVPASAKTGNVTMNGQVYGPVPGNGCISITCANITVETCAPCTNVLYNAVATDKCCDTNSLKLMYNPPETYCFPKGSTTPVQVIAYDNCGNAGTNYFTVTVNQATNCNPPPTNCITINASNIVAYTCNPCTPVSYKVNVTDQCCPASGVTVVYNPPETTCFPLNSATPVQVLAFDQCGHTNTATFTVTVLPGANCNPTPTNCITINASNIVVRTCEPCTPVAYNATASDQCCPLAPPGLTFSVPPGFCFPQGSTTPVEVTAFDVCGHTNTATFTVTVLPGVNCPTNCISIDATNITAYTCSNCTTVPISASVVDTCCPGAPPTVIYSLPATYCYPQNSTTPVQITAFDQCGHTNTTTITVTVLPAANCGPTNCITIYATNVTAYTCNACTTVPISAYAVDTCCASAPVTLTYSLPASYCYPLNSTTPVQVTAFDQCGHTNSVFILVTVLPAAGCAGSNPLSISGTTGPSPGGTNYITIWWPAQNARLMQSSNFNRWDPVPGTTNSPYVAPMQSPMKFYRLQYN